MKKRAKLFLHTNAMLDSISGIIFGVLQSSHNIINSVSQASHSLAQTQQGVVEQNQDIQNILQAMDGFNHSMQQASDGENIVSTAVTGINNIASKIDEAVVVINELERGSVQVGQVLDEAAIAEENHPFSHYTI